MWAGIAFFFFMGLLKVTVRHNFLWSYFFDLGSVVPTCMALLVLQHWINFDQIPVRIAPVWVAMLKSFFFLKINYRLPTANALVAYIHLENRSWKHENENQFQYSIIWLLLNIHKCDRSQYESGWAIDRGVACLDSRPFCCSVTALGQLLTQLHLSAGSIIWYWPKGGDALWLDLAESYGSLPLGLWL